MIPHPARPRGQARWRHGLPGRPADASRHGDNRQRAARCALKDAGAATRERAGAGKREPGGRKVRPGRRPEPDSTAGDAGLGAGSAAASATAFGDDVVTARRAHQRRGLGANAHCAGTWQHEGRFPRRRTASRGAPCAWRRCHWMRTGGARREPRWSERTWHALDPTLAPRGARESVHEASNVANGRGEARMLEAHMRKRVSEESAS